MTPTTSPTVAQWELALRLKQRLDELGMPAATLAKGVGFTGAYWSKIQSGRNVLTEDKLATILDYLEFGENERTELCALRAIAKQHGWWADYSALFSADLARFFGLEAGAESIRDHSPILIPGLLQTEDYARALITSNRTVPAAEVEQRVAFRMRRQQRLNDLHPLHLTTVIGQAALMQQTGGPGCLTAQLDHVATMIETHPDTIDLRIVPFTAPAGNAHGGGTFHLMNFTCSRLPTLAWRESAGHGELHDTEIDVRNLSAVFAAVQEMTLDRADSLNLIRTITG